LWQLVNCSNVKWQDYDNNNNNNNNNNTINPTAMYIPPNIDDASCKFKFKK
jgi:hypothetical protein